MTRAHRMAPEERRQSIIEATLPLLESSGLQPSSKQIAAAAGVAEGTLFRAFGSLQEIVDASIAAALSPERLRVLLTTVEFPGTLTGDTRTALQTVQRSLDAIRPILHAGHSAQADTDSQCLRDQFALHHEELVAQLTERFDRYREVLTVAPEQYARMLVLLAAGHTTHHFMGTTALSLDELTDFALHGASKEAR